MGEERNKYGQNPYKQSYKALAALWLAALALPALGADQTQSQQDARRLNNQGSDDSLDASYGNALHAVDNFFALNIPGAIKHGVKAYGQYRNSEKLEDLRDKNKQLAGSMSSVGAAGPSASGITGNAEYVSPYQRLDRKFLREGQTAVIAEKIERISGISREKMFQMAVDTHTNSKTLSDPDFVPWAMRTYRDLVKQSPKEEFRATLNKFGDKVESLITSGAVEGVLAQFRRQDAPAAPAAMVAELKPEIKNEEKVISPKADESAEPHTEAAASTAIAQPAGELPASPERTEDPASAFTARGTVGEISRNQRPGFDRLQFDTKDPFFAELARNANEAPSSEEEASIFKVVSRKIQEVSERQSLVRYNFVAHGR